MRAVVVPWAWDNPSALQLGFVSDLVREDLGAALTAPASEDDTRSSSSSSPATRRRPSRRGSRTAGIIASQRAFLYEARQDDLLPKLNAGRYSLAMNLTPAGVVDGPRQQPDQEPGPGHLPGGPARSSR